MAARVTIEVDASDFRAEMEESIGRFRRALAAGEAYPLVDLLTTDMLYPQNPEVVPLLRRRSNLTVDAGQWINRFAMANTLRYELSQEGKPINLQLTVPAAISLTPALGENEDRLTLLPRWPVLVLDEFEYNGRPIYLRDPFYLTEVVSTAGVLEYHFEDEAGSPWGVIRAVYDGRTLAAPDVRIRSFKDFVSLAQLVGTTAVRPDDVCEPQFPPRPLPTPVPAGHRVPVHIRILDPQNGGIDRQVEAAKTLYRSYGFDLDVRTSATINRPDLLDVDVGQCIMGQTTAEQNLLHALRAGIPRNEIAIYIIRSTIPPYGGCAAFRAADRPACVIARASSEWTLAHEIGHVLGLTHVGSTDRLMTGGGTGNITNPPPDLSQGEIATMMSSAYTREPPP